MELVRPEHFVPLLAGAAERHIFIATFGAVSFYHYDPYSQAFELEHPKRIVLERSR